MDNLVEELIAGGYLETDFIIEAFRKIDRADFVPENLQKQAYENSALPIDCGQTISQPLTVAFMLELLMPGKGQKILDVGSGSGWTAALLSCIVGKKGKVISIEIIKELKEFGENNANKYGFVDDGIADFIFGNATSKFFGEKYFDKILVSAAASEIPENLKKQLKIEGIMVIPVKNSIFLVKRISENEFDEKEFFGFSFVPLINHKK